MANEYVITIRSVLDMSAGAAAAAAAGTSPFANIERSAEAAARKVEKSFAGTGPRIYKALDAGRAQWVSSQISAAEQSAKGMIGHMVSAANETIKQKDRALRESDRIQARADSAERRRRDKETRDAERDIAQMQRERQRIVESSERAVEAAEQQSYARRVRNAQKFQREQSNALMGQLGPTTGSSTGGGTSLLAAAGLGGAIGGAVALVGRELLSDLRQGASAWVEYASKLQNAKIAFTAMLGSAAEAEVHLKELQKFAIETPFQFADLVDASQRMQALGFNAKEIVPILRDVGNAVAAAGGGAERLDRVIKALSDVRAKEKLQTQEIRQFAEAGISVYKILQEETGKSVAEIQKMTEAGQIGSDMFLRAFQKFSQVHFGDLMEKQSQTFTGAMSNIQDVLLQVASKAFDPLFAKISEIAFRVQQELQKAQDLSQVGDILANAFAELGGSLGEKLVEAILMQFTKAATWKRLLLGAWPAIFKTVKTFFSELTDTLDVWVGIDDMTKPILKDNEALAKGLNETADANDKLKGSTDRLSPSMRGQTKAVEDQIDAYHGLAAALKEYDSFAVKLAEPKFDALPAVLKDRAALLSQQLKTETAAQSGYGSLIQFASKADQDAAFSKAVLARREELIAFNRQIRETTAALAGPGGATKAYNDFIAGLEDPALQRALRTAQTFEKNIKAVDEAEQKAKQAQEQRQRDLIDTTQTLDQRLSELTEQHRQLNAEVGKAPDALKEYDLWWSRQSAKFKELIEQTPRLQEKLAAIRAEAAAFSKDQASAGMADLIGRINQEISRYGDGGRDTVDASTRLRNEFDKAGLAARAEAGDIERLNKALDELAAKEAAARAERQKEMRSDTTHALTNWRLQIDRMKSGRDETEAERIVQQLIGIRNLKIPETALEPISNALERVQRGEVSAGEAGYFLKQALDGYLQSARGSAIENEHYDETLNKIVSSLLDAAEATTPLARETRGLRQELKALQQEVSISAETAALRYEIAWQKAHNDVVLSDQRAREEMIASQEKIADQSVFHADRARASILDHMAQMKGATEIFSDAYIKTIDAAGNAIDKVLGKVTQKLGVFGDIIRGVLSDLLKLALNKVFRSLLDAILGPSGGGGSSGGGGIFGTGSGGGGSGGSIFGPGGGGILNLVGGGGGSQVGLGGAMQALITGRAGAFFNSPNLGNLTPQGSSSSQQTILRDIMRGSGVGGSLPGTGAGGGAQSLLQSLGAAGPMLGLTLGAGVGASFGRGSSTLATILGATGLGAVGLVAGSAIPAILTGAFAGLTALGAATLGIGAVLAVAAFIIGRNAQRRKEETLRAEWANEALPQVMALLTEAQGGHVTLADAHTRFEQIHSAYMSNVNTLKDSKTRRIATQWWDNDVQPFYWPKIEAAAKQGEAAGEFTKKFIPTYAIGGPGSRDAGLPGYYNNIGERLSWVDPAETVLTPEHVARLGGAGAMAAAGVPGYQNAANAAAMMQQTGSAAGNGGIGPVSGVPPVVIVVFSDAEARALLARMPNAVLAQKVGDNIGEPGSDFISRVAQGLNRGF